MKRRKDKKRVGRTERRYTKEINGNKEREELRKTY